MGKKRKLEDEVTDLAESPQGQEVKKHKSKKKKKHKKRLGGDELGEVQEEAGKSPQHGSPRKPKGKGKEIEDHVDGGERRDRKHRTMEAVLRLAPEDAVGPLLVSFANQTVPPDVDEIRFAIHGGNDASNLNQKIVMGEGSSYMVGVHDEESGEITLHQVGHAFTLRQSVAGKEESVEANAMNGVDWKQRKDALVEQFGSKKKKRVIKARDANIIQADSVVGGGSLSRVLAQALREGGEDGAGGRKADGAEDAVNEARRRFLPPFREDATTPQGVYLAEDIARGQELASMGREVDAEAAELEGGLTEWIRDFTEESGHEGRPRCPKYVAERIQRLQSPSSRPEQKQRLLELLYLRHMMEFANSGNFLRGKPPALARELGMNETILRQLLDKFSVKEKGEGKRTDSYGRTKTLKNQLVLHTLCLALVMEGCRLEFSQLAQDLKLTPADCRAMLRELGCGASGTTAQLKIPLVFPRPKRGRNP